MISVIIPVKNGASTLQECLRGVLNQKGVDYDVEVIVIDDGSTDGSRQIAEKMGAQVFSQKNMGPASARNYGARVAGSDILVFTDSDCIPQQGWLKYLVAPMTELSIIGTKGTYCTQQKSLIARFVQQEYELKYARMRKYEFIDFIDTYSAAYRRDVFLENGGFRTFFPVASAEDIELSFRLARKGCKMVFTPQAVVSHHHVNTLWGYFKRKCTQVYWRTFIFRWFPEKAWSDSHTLPSQRIQILLLCLFFPLLLISFIFPLALKFFLASIILFYITAFSMVCHIIKSDPQVLIITPLMLLIRAIAQTIGIIKAILFPPKFIQDEKS